MNHLVPAWYIVVSHTLGWIYGRLVMQQVKEHVICSTSPSVWVFLSKELRWRKTLLNIRSSYRNVTFLKIIAYVTGWKGTQHWGSLFTANTALPRPPALWRTTYWISARSQSFFIIATRQYCHIHTKKWPQNAHTPDRGQWAVLHQVKVAINCVPQLFRATKNCLLKQRVGTQTASLSSDSLFSGC